MTGVLVALLCWLLILVPGARRWQPSVWTGKSAALSCAVICLCLTPFWWRAELAGLETAFLCAWVLIYLPVARYRLDGAVVVASLVNGVVAAAFVGLAANCASLLGTVLDTVDTGLADIVTWLVLSIVFYIGATVCLIVSDRVFPWDYGAWFCGGLLIAQPALTAPLDKLNVAHGSVLVLVGYALLIGMRLGIWNQAK